MERQLPCNSLECQKLLPANRSGKMLDNREILRVGYVWHEAETRGIVVGHRFCQPFGGARLQLCDKWQPAQDGHGLLPGSQIANGFRRRQNLLRDTVRQVHRRLAYLYGQRYAGNTNPRITHQSGFIRSHAAGPRFCEIPTRPSSGAILPSSPSFSKIFCVSDLRQPKCA